MNLDDIKKFLYEIDPIHFDELLIELEGVKISIKRDPSIVASTEYRQDLDRPVTPPHEAAQPKKDRENIVTAPISGVFYRASEPGSEPFVSVGDSVKKGDILCYLEAMKTMNEIKAPKDGVIAEIPVEDDTRVEEGDILFKLTGGNE